MRVIDCTTDHLTDEVVFDLVQHLIRQSNNHNTVLALGTMMEQTASGEIEFNECDEPKRGEQA